MTKNTVMNRAYLLNEFFSRSTIFVLFKTAVFVLLFVIVFFFFCYCWRYFTSHFSFVLFLFLFKLHLATKFVFHTIDILSCL